MRGVTQTLQQNKRASRAAPIEHFETNILLNGDELRRMRTCIRLLRMEPRASRHESANAPNI
ncbi:MAG TPA: hypothetical protein VK789_23370 [Bryobacteraceae bacterium]|nr:hypothetical protein [Bryobacteraceae bacterium]